MPGKANANIVVVSFKVNPLLLQKLDERIIADGYGMRGKSRWLKEAIQQFLQLNDYAELVSLSEEGTNNKCGVSVRMPSQMALEIEKTVLAVRKQYPETEGVKSCIIRAAILQRMIRR